MARGNDTIWIVLLILVAVVIGLYYFLNRPLYSNNKQSTEFNTQDFQLLEPPSDESFAEGFGMGPGLYGSGRHTSEMIGN
jgi:hypothetical protein